MAADDPATDSDYLRRQAARCRRLARGSNDEVVAEALEAMAREFEERANRLDRRP